MNTRDKLLWVVVLAILIVAEATPQWVQTSGPKGGDIRAIVTQGTDLFAGTATSGGAFFRSTDNGEHWTKTGGDMPAILSLCINGSTFFAGTMGGGVFRSTDNGNFWVHTGPLGTRGQALTVTGSSVFAATDVGIFRSTNNGTDWMRVQEYGGVNCLGVSGQAIIAGTCSGVLRSTDGGMTWFDANAGLPNTSVLAFAVRGAMIFAGTGSGVYLSTDQGTSWTAAGLTTTEVLSLATNDNFAFAGTSDGLYRSTDDGTTWSPANTGLMNTRVQALAAVGAGLVAGTRFGVFVSTDDGASWTGAALTNTTVPSLAVVGSDLLAASYGGVFRSSNSGAEWENSGLVNIPVWSLARIGTDLFAATPGGVVRSTDNGTTWMPSSSGLMGEWRVTCFAIQGATLFAGTDGQYGDGLYRSTDNGVNWISSNSGLSCNAVTALAVSGNDLFAGTWCGMFRSSDNGETWTPGGLEGSNISFLVPSVAGLFAGTTAGVSRTTDGGETWTTSSAGLTSTAIKGFLVVGSHLFVGTDNGASWTALGPTGMSVLSLDTDGSFLFAGTTGEGVWRHPLGGFTGFLVNPGFESGTHPWKFYTDGTGRFSNNAPGYGSAHAGLVAITEPGTNIQLYQTDLSLIAHYRYRLRFQARSSTGHDLSIFLHRHTEPYTDYGLGRRVADLAASWRQFEFEFVTSGFIGTVTDARLRFWFATHATGGDQYFLDNVELIPLGPEPIAPATWAITYGGFAWEDANAVRQTSDGGYILAGATQSFGAGNFDVWILKLSGEGSVEWQKRYGGPEWDQANAVRQTPDGGYVVAGFTGSFGQGAQDGWVLRLQPDGEINWQRTYGGPADDVFNSVDLTPDGEILLAGRTASFASGERDGWVMRLHADGSPAWQQALGGSVSEELFDIQATADGGSIIAGCTNSFGAQLWDAWVLKLDANGSVDWQKRYDGGWYDCAYAAQQTDDGGYIVSARTPDAWVLKLDPDGSIAWQHSYGGPGYDNYWDSHIQQTRDGGYIVAGNTTSFGAGSVDIWLFKLRTDGDIAWQTTYGGSDWDGGAYVHETADGGYVVAGVTHSFGSSPKDAWILKLDSIGTCGHCPPNRPGSAVMGSPGGSAWITDAIPVPLSATFGMTTVSGVLTSAEPLKICPASSNLVLNPGFENGKAPWRFFTDGEGTFSNGAPGSGSAHAGHITITTSGTNVQLYQNELVLQPATCYRLSFRARSSSGNDMAVRLQKHTFPYTGYGLGTWVVDLRPTWRLFERTFQTDGFASTVSNGRLWFSFVPFAAPTDEFFIDDVNLEWLGTAKDVTPAGEPEVAALAQNYPNPFNAVTIISYNLPATERVTLRIYDLLGREVATLVDEMQEAGSRAVEWSASGLASGVYFYRLKSGEFTSVKKMIITK